MDHHHKGKLVVGGLWVVNKEEEVLSAIGKLEAGVVLAAVELYVAEGDTETLSAGIRRRLFAKAQVVVFADLDMDPRLTHSSEIVRHGKFGEHTGQFTNAARRSADLCDQSN